MPGLTPAALTAFVLAVEEARRLGSACTDREHVFIGILRCEGARQLQLPEMFGIGPAEQAAFLAEADALVPRLRAVRLDPTAARRRMRALWRETFPVAEAFSGHRSEECRALFSRAESRTDGQAVGLALLLWMLVEMPSPLVERCLREEAADRPALLRALAEACGQAPEPAEAAPGAAAPRGPAEALGRDLTRLAREGKLPLVVGRDEEIKQVARALLQAKKSSVILLGDAGVGKTAIVEGLALKLAAGKGPAALRDVRIVDLPLSSLVAGTSYRGEFEQRVRAVIDQAEADRDLVLFVDEIHLLIGAGATRGSAMDAAEILKPALARGSVRILGATTTGEYRQYIEKDAALERRFQVVWVEEPDRPTALRMLEGTKVMLEGHYRTRISDAALARAVDLSVRYLPDRRLPDKAIDLLDQACARALLESFSSAGPGAAADREIGPDDIATVVAARCRVPVERLTEDEGRRLLKMEEALGARVMGQEDAVRAVAEAVRSARAGLKHPRRPVGVFLFAGPTGTGKTELAKALAEFLFHDERRLIRIDMSEYQERHAIARLLGAPPGYVGYAEGGQLTEAVRNSPYSVVLFDEVEKSHPDVHKLFLQMFDDGRLTDAQGRTVDFSETVIILTSNLRPAAAPVPPRARMGFVAEEARAEPAHDLFAQALAKAFPPELRNRIQKVVAFRPLSRETASRLLDKLVTRANQALAEKGLSLGLSAEAGERILDVGWSEEFGGRALERAFRELVEEPLSRFILEGKAVPGARIRVVPEEESLGFEVGGQP